MTKKIMIVLIVLAAVIAGGFWLRYWLWPYRAKLLIKDKKLAVEIADNYAKQTLGLSGRQSLCASCGMLFVFEKAEDRIFWMKDMKFPLDIIFLRDKKVTGFSLEVPMPRDGAEIARVKSPGEADMVLEVNAGFVRKNQIQLEDEVRVLP